MTTTDPNRGAQRRTVIINIYAGPGAGKSTTAASVFAAMKGAGHSVELVTEYVKEWAWRGDTIRQEWDGLYITASQLRRESACYGKVDYIVTDSPLGLGVVFEKLYMPGSRIMYDVVRAIEARQGAAGVKRVNCLLRRSKPYVQAGRYEDEAAARRVDHLCDEFLRMQKSRPFHYVESAADVLRVAGVAL